MLENNQYDFSIYGGAALLLLVSVMGMVLMLWLFAPDVFRNLRKLAVLLLVLIISLGLSVVVVKLFHVYLSPITLAAILLTVLVGARAAIAGSVCISILVSGLVAGSDTSFSAEMVHLLLTGLMGSIVCIRFLRGKPQRLRVLLCGLLVALCNLVLMLAIDMMTSTNSQSIMTNALWSMGSGLLSGVLALGLQPVFETAFNLATPSKLMELSNPNQPLLRRLLLEAPGTYHHAIIVANLAEAAAEKIGANPLLARTGAYFHDVGKLKRPLYFKENQMGENPHDRTDPREKLRNRSRITLTPWVR